MKILIEQVDNGFIVSENYSTQDDRMQGYASSVALKKVFNTQKQLNKYINTTFNNTTAFNTK